MKTSSGATAARWFAAGVGIAAAVYGGYVAVARWRYGKPAPTPPGERDVLLDQFMPIYDVAERHRIEVDAPAPITLAVAREMDLESSGLVRTLVRAREAILGGAPDDRPHPRGLVDWMSSIGWGLLAEVSDREIVMGAATKPWEADVVFRALPPADFLAFSEPDYVKIVWTLRADPAAGHRSVFRTETRVIATDEAARTKFRRYWSLFSPGIIMIRWVMLGPVKKEAERRARAGASWHAGQS